MSLSCLFLLVCFLGYWLFWVMEFSRAFSHHHHPGDSCLSGSEAVLKGIGWRLGNVKSREEAAAVFVWNVFLFAPGLQKRAATCPGTLWRGCLEKNEQFAVHFCSTNCMLQILDETSLLDTFTKFVPISVRRDTATGLHLSLGCAFKWRQPKADHKMREIRGVSLITARSADQQSDTLPHTCCVF